MMTRIMTPTPRAGMVATCGGLAVLATLPLFIPGFSTFELTLVMVWAMAIVAVNLQLGYTGQLSVGANVSFAIGAYITAILYTTNELPLLVAVAVAVLVSALLGLFLGMLTAGLKDLYLAMATMALAVLTPQIASRFADVTGGEAGFITRRPTPPEWLGATSDQFFYWLVLVVGVLVFMMVHHMVTGPLGRALTAIRDGDMVARTQGIKVTRLKATVSCLSAGAIAASGGLYVVVVGIISPKTVGLILSINLIVALVVGGAASLSGAVAGGLFMHFAPKISSDIGAELGGIVFGVAVVLVVIAAPKGASALTTLGWRRLWRGRLRGRGDQAFNPAPGQAFHDGPSDVATMRGIHS